MVISEQSVVPPRSMVVKGSALTKKRCVTRDTRRIMPLSYLASHDRISAQGGPRKVIPRYRSELGIERPQWRQWSWRLVNPTHWVAPTCESIGWCRSRTNLGTHLPDGFMLMGFNIRQWCTCASRKPVLARGAAFRPSIDRLVARHRDSNGLVLERFHDSRALQGRLERGRIARELWMGVAEATSWPGVGNGIASSRFDATIARRPNGLSVIPPHARSPRRHCLFPDCPSHADPRASGIVRHGRMRSRTGSRTRFLCRACGRTFCGRRGSAYYRLHVPRRTFDRFAELLSEGLSCASLARVLGVSPSTISRWLRRASVHARAFADEHDRIRSPVELQFDEISARPAFQRKSPWVFNGIEVSSRYWAAALVGLRNHATTRTFVLQARQACGNLGSPLLITSDPFAFYERELWRAFGPACTYVQVKTNYWQNKIKRATPTVVIGSEEKLRRHIHRSEDSNRANTAFVERLNLHLRRSCSYLHRRTSGRIRNPKRLASAVEILRCGYNFVRPHGRLRWGSEERTPAMQAGIFDRVLSWRDVFAWPVRRPRAAVLLNQRLANGTRPLGDPASTVPAPSRVRWNGLPGGGTDRGGGPRSTAGAGPGSLPDRNLAPVDVEASVASSDGPIQAGVVSHLPGVEEGPPQGLQRGVVPSSCHVPDPLQSRFVSSCPPR